MNFGIESIIERIGKAMNKLRRARIRKAIQRKKGELLILRNRERKAKIELAGLKLDLQKLTPGG